MDIYKEDVLDAIAIEPLEFGDWINYNPFISEVCTTCVIGAVLVNSGVQLDKVAELANSITKNGPAAPLSNTIDLDGLVPRLPKSWANTLSYFWESLGEEGVPVREARVITYDWVEENVPEDEILFTIRRKYGR